MCNRPCMCVSSLFPLLYLHCCSLLSTIVTATLHCSLLSPLLLPLSTALCSHHCYCHSPLLSALTIVTATLHCSLLSTIVAATLHQEEKSYSSTLKSELKTLEELSQRSGDQTLEELRAVKQMFEQSEESKSTCECVGGEVDG